MTPPPDPTRVLVLGDTHGNAPFVRRASAAAVTEGCQTILQLGDFGMMPSGPHYLGDVTRILNDADLHLWFIRGNHDDPIRLAQTRRRLFEPSGVVALGPRIRWIPDGLRWTWSGVHFGALGGAFSVDMDSRVPGVNGWPDLEEPSEADMERLGDDPLDVLVTHDAPASARIDLGGRRLGSIMQARSHAVRVLLDEAMAATQPKLVLHGHHHRRLRTVTGATTIEGLAADMTRPPGQAWGVLDLTSGEPVFSGSAVETWQAD